ncbi:MAG: hypothetical protein Kow0059_02810 [Candidatus Sumerlaeia bacterium]
MADPSVQRSSRPWYRTLYDFVDGILQGFFRILTKIVLGLCFFTVFALTAIILKLMGKRLLPGFPDGTDSYWLPKEPIDLSLERITRQG